MLEFFPCPRLMPPLHESRIPHHRIVVLRSKCEQEPIGGQPERENHTGPQWNPTCSTAIQPAGFYDCRSGVSLVL
jgi:hypothetical protein